MLKKLKGMLEKVRDILIIFFVCTWWLWVFIIGMFIAYKISVSNLPDWFKFFLLHR